MQKISTPLLVVAAALIDARGRVLVQRRCRDAEHGGLWEFPGGKVEPGETPVLALIREIGEELAVVVGQEALQPLAFASDAAAPGDGRRPVVILLYTCRVWRGEPECRDAEEIRWTAVRDLPQFDMPPLDYPLARALAGSI